MQCLTSPLIACIAWLMMAVSTDSVDDIDLIGDFIVPPEVVNCGGHYAETCTLCPRGQGPLYCNGQCIWVYANCEHNTAWTSLKRSLHDVSDWCWIMLIWCLWMYFPAILLLGIGMFVFAVLYKNRVVDEFPHRLQ